MKSIYSNLWQDKPKTYTQIAKELGKGANPSTIKKYCMIMAGLDGRTKKLKDCPLNWGRKRNHLYYSINYNKLKKKTPNEYNRYKKEFEKRYNYKIASRDFDYFFRKFYKEIFKD